eukprot:1852880-Prymnesium_polylepis.1
MASTVSPMFASSSSYTPAGGGCDGTNLKGAPSVVNVCLPQCRKTGASGGASGRVSRVMAMASSRIKKMSISRPSTSQQSLAPGCAIRCACNMVR